MSFAWRTRDGESRGAGVWLREPCAGVVACIHGLSGGGQGFGPVAERLRDFSVYAIELRGQGLDPVVERRARVLDVEAQHRDLEDFIGAIRAAHPGKPVFLLGESMGSLLCASLVAARPGVPVDGLVLSVPVVALTRPVPGWMKGGVRWLGRTFPDLKFYPSWFVTREKAAPPLTRDRAYQDSLKDRPHHISVFTLRFLSELGDLILDSDRIASGVRKPVLVLAAGKDCFVTVPQIERWFVRVASKEKCLRVYPEAYHLLWHDDDREEVLDDVASWLAGRLAAEVTARP